MQKGPFKIDKFRQVWRGTVCIHLIEAPVIPLVAGIAVASKLDENISYNI